MIIGMLLSHQHDKTCFFQESLRVIIVIIAIIGVVAFVFGLEAMDIFTVEQMYIIRPILVSCAVFVLFSYVLWSRVRANIFGEIGFIYLALALAYTILPAITFFKTDFNILIGFDGIYPVLLSPRPEELGAHFWRHVLFMSGVAIGYLSARGRMLPTKYSNDDSTYINGRIIAFHIALVGCCIGAVTLLSSPVTSYIEHYTRYDDLSWPVRRFVYICLILKFGGYFVLMALMFSQYRKYRLIIFIVVPVLCAYESIYSYGSRLQTLTLLMAVIGFYNFKVKPISLKKGVVLLIALAVLFSGIELIRSSNYSLENAQYAIAEEGIKQASEFGAVFNTGFHLYNERSNGTLPTRPWQMFFTDIISLVPFLDHTANNPQYWYAQNYFPESVVPPQTMGVIAESAIWGGELDLLLRSLLNGVLFALLIRWFLRRREKWWALIVYIYCYATCIMTLKYSVLYQFTPLIRILLPTLILTGLLLQLQKTLRRFKLMPNESVPSL